MAIAGCNSGSNSARTGQRTIPAVSYIRMSNDKQETSPSQQRDEVAKLATSRGYHILREYINEGISGDATDKRLQFRQMIEDAEKGEFKAIFRHKPTSSRSTMNRR